MIVCLGVLYEYLRLVQADYDQRLALQLKGKNLYTSGAQHSQSEYDTLLSSCQQSTQAQEGVRVNATRVDSNTDWIFTYRVDIPFSARVSRAAFYGGSIFLSFFLMLVFMTYNVRLQASPALAA